MGDRALLDETVVSLEIQIDIYMLEYQQTNFNPFIFCSQLIVVRWGQLVKLVVNVVVY
jgi:hypothetical protein